MNTEIQIKKTRPPYLLGILCLIPLVGAFVGMAMILLGLIKYKDKWMTLIGVFGILFTAAVYSTMFYAVGHSKTFKKAFVNISKMQMVEMVKSIEFYKLQYGHYPDSLQQLRKDDSLTPIYDASQISSGLRTDSCYNYKRVGEKYTLFSSGNDGIPNTKDDLYPKISIPDSSKIGLIRAE